MSSYVDIKKASPANSFGANAVLSSEERGRGYDSLFSVKDAQRFFKDIRKISDKRHQMCHQHLYHLTLFWAMPICANRRCVISHRKTRELRAKGENHPEDPGKTD
jgi:hypothetical protein